MGSGRAHVTLLSTKRIVEDFKKERGFDTFSEALRFIITDYFRIMNKFDEARAGDFEKVCDLIAGKRQGDFSSAVAEDLDEIKQKVSEIQNMLVLVSTLDDKWHDLFKKYFPKYFK